MAPKNCMDDLHSAHIYTQLQRLDDHLRSHTRQCVYMQKGNLQHRLRNIGNSMDECMA